jgi:hypothetical protein
MQPRGLALRMRCELAALADRHRTPSPVPQVVPSLPDADGAMTLAGYATTDRSREDARISTCIQ